MESKAQLKYFSQLQSQWQTLWLSLGRVPERERGRERELFFLCSVPKGRREWERVQTKRKGKGKGQTDTILSFLLFLNAHTHIPIPSIRSHHIQSFSSKIHKFINKSHTLSLYIDSLSLPPTSCHSDRLFVAPTHSSTRDSNKQEKH